MNNIGLIDIGANLTHPELYNQLDKIVENLQSAHIKKVIIIPNPPTFGVNCLCD